VSRWRNRDTGDPVIDQMIAGTWENPETEKRAEAIPFEDIRILDTTDGGAEDLVGPLDLGRRLAVVSDPRTHEALGARVRTELKPRGTIDDVVIDAEEATMEMVRLVREKTRHAEAVIAVGSGTLQDLVKYATFLDGRRFATFATAASMNGYTSVTASITEGGMKHSWKAHTPAAVFMDVDVAAKAPPFLARAGIGDCLCRSTAQVDWRLSAALFGTPYFEVPFLLQKDDEALLLEKASGVGSGDRGAIRILYRLLTWAGLGTCFTGTSHHGSMSEHMISHWIDMFAGSAHPGTLHGHQVGYAAISISRLQNLILTRETPPYVRETRVDAIAMKRRYGAALGASFEKEFRGKALDAADARRVNAAMEKDWDRLRGQLQEVMLPTETLVTALDASGGYSTAEMSGLPRGIYRDAILRAREIRNRFCVLDLADDAGELEAFADMEAGTKARPTAAGRAH
jgi:glycerol-1-phosphate dehydrogenase [NAD(P)+]